MNDCFAELHRLKHFNLFGQSDLLNSAYLHLLTAIDTPSAYY
jgi:hypothetical protein